MKSKNVSPARNNGPQGLSPRYMELLTELKTQISSAQLRAAQSVNQELVLLYWRMGKQISERMKSEGWGSKVIDRLAVDLHRSFPEMKGFSPRNLRYMRAFAETYQDEQFLQQAVAKLPWGHNVRILDYAREPAEREFYVHKTIEHGWSRNVLVHQIESDLYRRQGKAIANFDRTLPALQSELASQILKDPYNFDFLSLSEEIQERDLERALNHHLREFLLELGVGFAFVGSQFHMEVGGEDFYIDMLFYHLRLRCYIVVELKISDFQPEFAGKMNFYLSAVDDLLRHSDDGPSIGLILCRTRNRIIVEYALRDTQKPMSVATYQITASLPEHFKGCLPTVEELEVELKDVSGKENVNP
jgi:predicted nuclease of restriction endonuclease-like (RecB) superfamily